MSPLLPDPAIRRADLWSRFLWEPGVWQQLLRELEAVSRLDLEAPACDDDFQPLSDLPAPGSEDDFQPPAPACQEDFQPPAPACQDDLQPPAPACEDDFQPLSESSRLSLLEPALLGDRESNINQHLQAHKITSPRLASLVGALLSPRSPLPPMSPRTPRTPDPESDTSSVFFLERNIDQVPDRNLCSPRREEGGGGIKVAVIQVTPGKGALAGRPRVTTPYRSTPAPAIVEAPPRQPPERQRPPATISIPPFHPALLPLPVLPPALVTSIQQYFSSLPGGKVTPQSAPPLCSLLSLPPLLSTSLLLSVYGGEGQGGCAQLLAFWQRHSRHLQGCDRIFHLLSGCRGGPLLALQLEPLVLRVLASHPQLQFFRGGSSAAHRRAYVEGVVASLLWAGGGWRRGVLHRRQFLGLELEALLEQLEDPEQDLNMVPHFSYDQFFVLYVKFVALDTTEAGRIGPAELMEFEGGGQLTVSVVSRVFSRCLASTTMDFPGWVHFVLAQVDTTLPSSLDYWLTVLDTGDDGLLSLQELRPFYRDSVQLLLSCGLPVQPVAWEDLVTQLLDTTPPALSPGGWSRAQLRQNAKFHHVVNAFVNIFTFVLEDESDVCIRSSIPLVQKFVLKALQDMDT